MLQIQPFLLTLSTYLSPLSITIIILVFLPSCIAVGLRFVLYSRLKYIHKRVRKLIEQEKSSNDLEINLEEEPELINKLIKRFKRASKVLEHVNTAALLDQIYSEEKIGSFSCEQVEYFCRILPNLLLAFGLFGTFLGLTISLSALSQTMSQTNTTDIGSLITELQKPLQGMSIAFVASLAGLSCSTGLIFFNSRVNTGLKKLQLISSLEDYLDNIYRPTVEGYSRIDKAVEKMGVRFDEFLIRFGVTVRESIREGVESSLGEKMEKIYDANKIATELATEVYTRFLQASATIERGAIIFLESTNVIKNTHLADNILALTKGLENAQKEFSQSSLLLNNSIKFTENATKLLDNSVNKVTELNERTVQVLAVTQRNQQSLNEIVSLLCKVESSIREELQVISDASMRATDLATEVYTGFVNASGNLERGATIFLESTEVIQTNQFPDKLLALTEGLANAQKEFSQSSLLLNDSIKFIENSTKLIDDSANKVTDLNEQTAQVLRASQTNQQSVNEMVLLLHGAARMFQPAINRIDELQNRNISTADSLDGMEVKVSKLVETVKFYTEQVSLEMQGLCNQLGESVATQQMFNNSVKFTEAATKSLDNSANKITDLNKQTAQVLALTQTNQQSFSQIVAILYKTAEKFQPVIDKIDDLQNRNVSTTSNLDNIQTEISHLIITVKDHTKQMSLEMQDLCNQLVKNITAQQGTGNNYQDKTVVDETKKVRENPRDRFTPDYNSFEKQNYQFNKNEVANQQTNLNNTSVIDGLKLTDLKHKLLNASTAFANREYQEAATAIDELINVLQNSSQIPELSLLKESSYLLKGNIQSKLENYGDPRAAYQRVLDISSDSRLREKAKQGLLNIEDKFK